MVGCSIFDILEELLCSRCVLVDLSEVVGGGVNSICQQGECSGGLFVLDVRVDL